MMPSSVRCAFGPMSSAGRVIRSSNRRASFSTSRTSAVEPATIVSSVPIPATPRRARVPQAALPSIELPPAEDQATMRATSPADGPDLAQPARAPETTPPVASPTPKQEQTTPQATSLPALLPPTQSPASQRLSPAEIAALVTRGDGFLSTGDIASARLFYERAADVGDGSAALRLGATLDPSFLGRIGVRGTTGDPYQASFWYCRARDLGNPAAGERPKIFQQQCLAEPDSPTP